MNRLWETVNNSNQRQKKKSFPDYDNEKEARGLIITKGQFCIVTGEARSRHTCTPEPLKALTVLPKL